MDLAAVIGRQFIHLSFSPNIICLSTNFRKEFFSANNSNPCKQITMNADMKNGNIIAVSKAVNRQMIINPSNMVERLKENFMSINQCAPLSTIFAFATTLELKWRNPLLHFAIQNPSFVQFPMNFFEVLSK